MLEWFEAHRHWLPWVEGFAVVGFVGSLVLLPWLIARIPTNYFADAQAPPSRWARHHPLIRLIVRGLRNVVGIALVAIGLVLLVLPGQGILTALIGLSLVDFPGKRRMELWLVSRPGIFKAVNWIRAKAHHPPLELPRSSAAQRG